MRYRQIHLDFHTSPVITDVGSDFDVDDFVNTLKEAHVNSINIFAKCHHGMCYYPTKVGKMHPALSFDLLGTMIEHLHKENIKCPVYFPLGWEEDAAEHTEWLEIGKDSIPGHKRPDDASYYSWRKLCLNNADYKEYIKKQLAELINGYDIDGLWFDIISQKRCLCPTCLEEMKTMGLNFENEHDVLIHDEHVLCKLQKELNDYVSSFGKNIPTFYNSSWQPVGTKGFEIDNRAKLQDHMEIESLPSGEWGYNHFPLFVNYHNRNNEDVIGMNGKFHLSWGDHGSLKNQEALEFEVFRMVANGCACSIGDQLHPRGMMNKSAYKRIGNVYSEIEKLEPYITDTKKVSEIGVLVSNDFFTRDASSDEGVLRMMIELHLLFDFIPSSESFEKYKLLILPDKMNIDSELSNRLKEYIENGGKVIATAKSTDAAALSIESLGDMVYEPGYMVIKEDSIPGIDALEYVCYKKGICVKSDLPVIAYAGDPYYNRTADCFSSHRHFPFNKESQYPAVLLNKNVGYCAFPLFEDYIVNGNHIYRDIISHLIQSLLEKPFLKTNAPTCSETTVREKENSVYVHILNYIPERRTKTIDIVDTKLPLYNIDISIQKQNVKKAFAVRQNIELPITYTFDGYAQVSVPKIDGYEIVRFQ